MARTLIALCTSPLTSLRGIKVDVVSTVYDGQTMALADDGSVYAWGTNKNNNGF
jgi:alpha-tubulin suppressor-like RCC1 family protein